MQLKIKIKENELLKIIDRKLDEVAEDIFNNSQRIIVDKGIIDQGTLLKSGNINRSFLEKEIIYSALYADIIEFGRLPGTQPPVDALKNWVRRKGISNNEQEISKIAWAIATDIKKNGLIPRPYLGPAVEIVRQKMRSI